MEAEGSLSLTQKPVTGPCPETDTFRSHPSLSFT